MNYRITNSFCTRKPKKQGTMEDYGQPWKRSSETEFPRRTELD